MIPMCQCASGPCSSMPSNSRYSWPPAGFSKSPGGAWDSPLSLWLCPNMGIICAIQIAILGVLEQTHPNPMQNKTCRPGGFRGSGAVEHCPPVWMSSYSMSRNSHISHLPDQKICLIDVLNVLDLPDLPRKLGTPKISWFTCHVPIEIQIGRPSPKTTPGYIDVGYGCILHFFWVSSLSLRGLIPYFGQCHSLPHQILKFSYLRLFSSKPQSIDYFPSKTFIYKECSSLYI